MKITLLILLAMLSQVVNARPTVVYGEDHRTDIYASTNSMYVALAESTAAMISANHIIRRADGLNQIIGSKLMSRPMNRRKQKVCSTERFANQITASTCSGFLVGDDLIATAGHCDKMVKNACSGYYWVFDYAHKDQSEGDITVRDSDIYRCKRVVKSVLDVRTGNDWAVFQLDRKVNRRVLRIRREASAPIGTPLVVIGHPSGLPSKIADGAVVKAHGAHQFASNVDTFQGNSGSAVFNAQTGEVEGILVNGREDYIASSPAPSSCLRVNTLPDHADRYEGITYITEILEAL